MKITLFLLSILLFSAYTFTFTSGAKVPKAEVNATVSTKAMPKAAGLPEAIRDVAGKIVRPDAYYYILPANSGKGGGLTLDSIGDYGCPLWVVQEPYGYMYGTSVKFYPVNFQKGVIRLSTDMNIEFSGPNYCGESNVWKLGEFDSSMEKYFLGADGIIGNPSEDTLNNWFTIERSGNAYKLVHCPSVCSDCDPICQDVGIVYHDGKIRLALTDGDALKVVFRKA